MLLISPKVRKMSKENLKSLYNKALKLATIVSGWEERYLDYVSITEDGNVYVHFSIYRTDESEGVELDEKDLSEDENIVVKRFQDQKTRLEKERLERVEKQKESNRVLTEKHEKEQLAKLKLKYES